MKFQGFLRFEISGITRIVELKKEDHGKPIKKGITWLRQTFKRGDRWLAYRSEGHVIGNECIRGMTLSQMNRFLHNEMRRASARVWMEGTTINIEQDDNFNTLKGILEEMMLGIKDGSIVVAFGRKKHDETKD